MRTVLCSLVLSIVGSYSSGANAADLAAVTVIDTKAQLVKEVMQVSIGILQLNSTRACVCLSVVCSSFGLSAALWCEVMFGDFMSNRFCFSCSKSIGHMDPLCK